MPSSTVDLGDASFAYPSAYPTTGIDAGPMPSGPGLYGHPR
jgi:hypothetical protein